MCDLSKVVRKKLNGEGEREFFFITLPGGGGRNFGNVGKIDRRQLKRWKEGYCKGEWGSKT